MAATKGRPTAKRLSLGEILRRPVLRGDVSALREAGMSTLDKRSKQVPREIPRPPYLGPNQPSQDAQVSSH